MQTALRILVFIHIVVFGLAAMPANAAQAADAATGKDLFRERCLACHSALHGDAGGAMGPSLAGVVGRRAGSAPGYPYTDALRAARLTWDPATLERFLAAPAALVPGTAMAIAVDSASERGDLVAYLQSLPPADAAPAAVPPTSNSHVIPASTRARADWRQDKPGRRHRIALAELPPPFATPSARNNAQPVPRPADAALQVPRGFRIDTYASGLHGPRKMLLAANGDIFLTEMAMGRVLIMHPAGDGTHAARIDVYAGGLKQPFGMAFYPSAKTPQWLYVAATDQVVRYPYQIGDINPHGEPQVVIANLPHGAGHVTRDIVFSADGARLFVSVGSGSNVAEGMSKKTPQQIAAWEIVHGVGASWDEETDRAMVLAYDAAAPALGKAFATGIRNCVSLTLQPATGALWCTTNERDALGDDLVPDYSTRLSEGGFFGWPWYYFGAHQDPRHAGERPDLAAKVLVPDVPYQAHSAALSMTFYAANGGQSAFPDDYVGDAFVAFHGSWNRSLRTGYKLVRVRMNKGIPNGEYQDFVTGFIVDDGAVWGRPVATVQLEDGSLLLSDDLGNSVYRISHPH